MQRSGIREVFARKTRIPPLRDSIRATCYRATDITGSALTLHFKLDAVGDIVAEGNAVGVPTPSETYQYDPLYRLQQVGDASGIPWQSYTYDKTGDRLSRTTARQTPSDTYSYTPSTHHLIGISSSIASQKPRLCRRQATLTATRPTPTT